MKDKKITTLLGEAIAVVITFLVATIAIGLLFRVVRFVWMGY